MGKNPSGGTKKPPGADEDVLRGTTLRIYGSCTRRGCSMGLHEIQRALDLEVRRPSHSITSTSSMAAGLVKEQAGGGYYVDRLVFENMIRIKDPLIPFQTTYTIFFISTLVISTHQSSTGVISSLYLFAIAINLASVLIPCKRRPTGH